MIKMKRMTFFILVLLSICLPVQTVRAETETLIIGYLEYEDDPRYEESYTDDRFPAQPWGRPTDGIEAALKDTRFAAMAAGVQFKLERRSVAAAEELLPALNELHAAGAHFFLLDLPGKMVVEVASKTRGMPVLLFNLSALDDDLRQEHCQPHLMHLAPSRTMLTDAVSQFLVFKKWRDLLVLKGTQPEDAAYYKAFLRSAKRFGIKPLEVKDFVLGRDPRQRSKNNVALLTAGVDYEVLYVIDSHGEFARDVPYQDQKPRAVVGAAGLVADWWHWAWERNGAPQVNKRFFKTAKRPMTGYDWSGWIAIKVIAETLIRSESKDFPSLAAYIRGEDLALDGSKGYQLNFRSWNNQLRQPIFLTTPNWVVAQAPLDGFLHPTNNLDTLGFDDRESACKF
ncbi:MAG: amino acid ABC transporter substrate-binding protein [Deltaproteobacteria bacterium]|jgi:ABC transporter substrate binding protein (PQQ-dependent alcohol dehydrogenase system)|nr:amino acid ABC transporter substrate-binding protein [Deltaproteobacteria bacterium]MBW2503923.1 amino acid ABC transporter substrate-binding protein [Deltaproteobacteria bacterium]MBW2519712.1 amino acid ABC transporter substrate-binding protein [Deltaproteobacteria bacterium]